MFKCFLNFRSPSAAACLTFRSSSRSQSKILAADQFYLGVPGAGGRRIRDRFWPILGEVSVLGGPLGQMGTPVRAGALRVGYLETGYESSTGGSRVRTAAGKSISQAILSADFTRQ